jgi:cytochrome c551/c552
VVNQPKKALSEVFGKAPMAMKPKPKMSSAKLKNIAKMMKKKKGTPPGMVP